ncbi:hypothetical protein MESS4_830502 [Mesorhizobium sp. STM 4661]|nr:hypothetical protein MESS4_830502 [Mesorhizobium sp. STM 4661]
MSRVASGAALASLSGRQYCQDGKPLEISREGLPDGFLANFHRFAMQSGMLRCTKCD